MHSFHGGGPAFYMPNSCFQQGLIPWYVWKATPRNKRDGMVCVGTSGPVIAGYHSWCDLTVGACWTEPKNTFIQENQVDETLSCRPSLPWERERERVRAESEWVSEWERERGREGGRERRARNTAGVLESIRTPTKLSAMIIYCLPVRRRYRTEYLVPRMKMKLKSVSDSNASNSGGWKWKQYWKIFLCYLISKSNRWLPWHHTN